MKKTRITRAQIYKYSIILASIVFVFAMAVFLLSLWEQNNGQYEDYSRPDSYLQYNGKKYELRNDVESFLILGLDKFSGEQTDGGYYNDMQCDMLILVVFDNTSKSFTTVQIDRDTMTSMNVLGVAGNTIGTITQQIALSHTYGDGGKVSCRNSVDAVSDLLGVKINHYMSLTMDVVPTFNDMIGGVEVKVMDDMTDLDPALIKDATVNLNGEQALLYVRGRQSLDIPTNEHRMERQAQYVKAALEKSKLSFEADDTLLLETINAISPQMVSDLNIAQMQSLYEKVGGYTNAGNIVIEGEHKVVDNHMQFYPSPASVTETAIKLFYNVKQ